MPYRELTEKHLNNLKRDISDAMAIKNLDSSGNASASLRVDNNKLLGADYIYYLDQGRAPGKFPPPRNLIEWVRQKLNVTNSEAKSAAFLIGRKISREGTAIYNDKSKGLELDELIADTLAELKKELPKLAKAEFLKFATK